MKLFYVGGLEHSGTTLTEQLLSSHPDVLSLGEIASFFSPLHMKNYMNKWGNYPDVSTCSCGAELSECAFWADLIHLSGLHSDLPIRAKYQLLIKHVSDKMGPDVIVTDSSKSLHSFRDLLAAGKTLGLPENDLCVILTIKDARSFASSMLRKSGSNGLRAAYSAMNFWRVGNREWIDEFSKLSAGFFNLYEHLCLDPLGQVNRIFDRFHASQLNKLDVANKNSHIAMGNKDFLMRNRSQVSYDQRWFLQDNVQVAYLLNRNARSLNRRIYALSRTAQSVAASATGP